jgi:hypothetical protein
MTYPLCSLPNPGISKDQRCRYAGEINDNFPALTVTETPLMT